MDISKITISQELQLLCCLSLPTIDAVKLHEVRLRFQQGIDEDRFKALLEQHRVWPCVYRHLKALDLVGLSEAFQRYLEQKQRRQIKLTRQQFMHSARIKQAFNNAGIDAYSFKGFELAQQLYGDLALRHSHDIDMLVKPEHYERARVALADIGFTSSVLDDFPPYFIDRLRLATKDFTFSHKDGTILELHSRLTVANSKLSRYAVSHRSLQSFTDENLNFYIIYLCWHGAHTQFHRLKWLVDIALIIKNNDINWSDLMILARELKQQRALLVALNLCQRVYGCEVPVSLSTGLFQDAMVRFFVKRSMHKLELTTLTRRSFVDQLKTLPDVFVSDSVWEGLLAFRTKFRINAFDIQFLPMLPARFCWLYTFAKPLALFRRHVLVDGSRNTNRQQQSSSTEK